MQTVFLVVHVLVSLALIVLVLLQQGKGADAGAAFGSGASATVFGARGSASFLTRTTAFLATMFFVTSLALAYFSTQHVARKSVTDIVAPVAPQPAAGDVPSAPAEQTAAPATTDVPSAPAEQPAAPSGAAPKE